MDERSMGVENAYADRADAAIGVFDSGVGGLTVAREIMRQIPNEKVIYFGDTARVPYGNKSKETVTKYSRQIVRFLSSHHVKTIVVACNTASACALEVLEEECDIPLIGVVKPGARAALEATRNGRIGVIGTLATIHSAIYPQYIATMRDGISIYQKACPLLVPLVEEGLLKDPVTDEIARRYLEELIDRDIDTLILGCTHYPLIRTTLCELLGKNVTVINPAYETAQSLRQMLGDADLLRKKKPALGDTQYQFYVSDMAEKFQNFANSIIKYGILSAKAVDIEEY
ncbi:MAG: glutamate racemase [Lachnospiraceae bacterium]|jgi:glutamate racemase|nr:glutamate racemase [Lachnospiraceae bacterium]